MTGPSQAAPDAEELLSNLESMHNEILKLVQDLADLTREANGRMDAVSGVRMRLTQASRRRSDYLEAVVYPFILSTAQQGDIAQVVDLRDAGVAGRLASTTHIAKWTLAKIAENWPGYVEASKAMRASMQARISMEKAVIYPILRRM